MTWIWRLHASRQLRGVVAACLVGMVGAGFSARATLKGDLTAEAPPLAQGYEAEDHFPGAAYFFATEQDGSQPAGTTGTTDLPNAPPPPEAAAYANDPSIHPAQPFTMPGADGQDRARAQQCLTAAIYYEAAREPDDGQRAVAQVILNRVRHPAFPATICGVVYQGSERSGCQFSFACDGSMARAPNQLYWARAARVATEALSGQVFAPVGLATHYHTYAVTPSWNRTLVMTAAIGAHFFHRWSGAWGTPAAFTQVWRGHEPLPGPHARLVQQVAALAPTPSVPAPAQEKPSQIVSTRLATSGQPLKPVQVTPPTPAKPTGAILPPVQTTPAKGTPKPAADAPKWSAEQELPESTMLDRWRDSGRPK